MSEKICKPKGKSRVLSPSSEKIAKRIHGLLTHLPNPFFQPTVIFQPRLVSVLQNSPCCFVNLTVRHCHDIIGTDHPGLICPRCEAIRRGRHGESKSPERPASRPPITGIWHFVGAC